MVSGPFSHPAVHSCEEGRVFEGQETLGSLWERKAWPHCPQAFLPCWPSAHPACWFVSCKPQDLWFGSISEVSALLLKANKDGGGRGLIYCEEREKLGLAPVGPKDVPSTHASVRVPVCAWMCVCLGARVVCTHAYACVWQDGKAVASYQAQQVACLRP